MRSIRDENKMGAYFKVFVNNQDVSSFVTFSGITLVDGEDRIRTLEFSLKNANFWMGRISRGMPVQFYGGSMDVRNRRWLFKGVVKQNKISFPKNGSAELTILAFGGAYRGARNTKDIVYPHPQSSREWARNKEIKRSEIVKGILNESFYHMEQEVDIQNDFVYTYKKPFVQKGTDWAALRELADKSTCILAETDSGNDKKEHKILFVDRKNYATRNDGKTPEQAKEFPLSFRYIERSAKVNAQLHEETDELFSTRKGNDGEIIVDSITFNQNVDLNSGGLRIVANFDEASGSNKMYIQEFREQGPDKEDLIINYELKPTAYFRGMGDDEVDRLWDRITYNWDEVTFDEIKRHFVEIKPENNIAPGYEKSDIGMEGDGPLGFIGYEVSIELIGDAFIEPYRRYPIYGMNKYSSMPDGRNKYYLRTLTQTFNDAGYLQTLDFYR